MSALVFGKVLFSVLTNEKMNSFLTCYFLILQLVIKIKTGDVFFNDFVKLKQ